MATNVNAPPPPPPPPPPKRLALPSDDPLERDIEGEVCRYAKSKGFYVRKFVSPAHRSVPDRLLITPRGTLFFIEFKRRGKRATDDQQREHDTLRDYAKTTYVIDNATTGKALIEEMKTK